MLDYIVMRVSSPFPTTAWDVSKPSYQRRLTWETLYNVAVSSLTRYYETMMEDTIFLREEVVREKRSTNPNLSITDVYLPIADKEAFIAKYNTYLTAADPIIGHADDEDAQFTVAFTVGTKK